MWWFFKIQGVRRTWLWLQLFCINQLCDFKHTNTRTYCCGCEFMSLPGGVGKQSHNNNKQNRPLAYRTGQDSVSSLDVIVLSVFYRCSKGGKRRYQHIQEDETLLSLLRPNPVQNAWSFSVLYVYANEHCSDNIVETTREFTHHKSTNFDWKSSPRTE